MPAKSARARFHLPLQHIPDERRISLGLSCVTFAGLDVGAKIQAKNSRLTAYAMDIDKRDRNQEESLSSQMQDTVG